MTYEEMVATLPDDVKGNETFKSVPDFATLAKGYVEANGKLSDAITLPGDAATDEERAAFFTKLGRPEAADKYTLEKPVIEGVKEWTPDMEKDLVSIRDLAFKLGLSGKQAQGMLDWYGQEITAQGKAAESQADKLLAPLKEEWGDKYDERLAEANKVVTVIGGKEWQQLRAASGIGMYRVVIKSFLKLAPLVAEGRQPEGERGPGKVAGMSEADAASVLYGNP